MNDKNYINFILGAIGSFTAVTISIIFRNIKKIDAEKEMPAEYWIAKKADTEAQVERYRIDVESRERLILDKRERDDAEKIRQREFELNAPQEYWDSKALEEREKTAREREITRRKFYES